MLFFFFIFLWPPCFNCLWLGTALHVLTLTLVACCWMHQITTHIKQRACTYKTGYNFQLIVLANTNLRGNLTTHTIWFTLFFLHLIFFFYPFWKSCFICKSDWCCFQATKQIVTDYLWYYDTSCLFSISKVNEITVNSCISCFTSIEIIR